jgi:hypothetical protein
VEPEACGEGPWNVGGGSGIPGAESLQGAETSGGTERAREWERRTTGGLELQSCALSFASGAFQEELGLAEQRDELNGWGHQY